MDIQGTGGNSATDSDHLLQGCNGCRAITDTEDLLKSEDWCPRATVRLQIQIRPSVHNQPELESTNIQFYGIYQVQGLGCLDEKKFGIWLL
jgi:hypothetical protein